MDLSLSAARAQRTETKTWPDQNTTTPLSPAIRLMIGRMKDWKIGTLTVTMPNGETRTFKGMKDAHKQVALTLHNDRPIKRLLTGGKLGFCESYMDGEWSSPDITALFSLILENSKAIEETLRGQKWMRALAHIGHRLRPNSKAGSRKNIYAHYDLGNGFYSNWLDRSMTYSAALFTKPQMSLEAAQDAKYQRILDELAVTSDDHILEIGCGWGGFAEYAARKSGCRITAVTISPAQHEYAVKRIKAAGLTDRVEIKLCDYRDLSGQYDHIVSIEMFEAVGERYWPVYFQTLKNRLRPGGQALLQIITIRDQDFDLYRRGADFIQRYIFPGGMLPSPKALRRQVNAAKMAWLDCFSFGHDYARTLAHWHNSFQAAWPLLTRTNEKFDARFKRMWELYLSYCEAGFKNDRIDVIHLKLGTQRNDGTAL